jgi:hypothetical protein
VKIFITIAHFHRPDPQGQHGSQQACADQRLQTLARCLRSIHSLFGDTQGHFARDPGDRRRVIGLVANQDLAPTVQVTFCTAGRDHLLDALVEQWPPGDRPYFRHQPVDLDPLYLGFACQVVLQQALADPANYDYFCYLEDDSVFHDPWFFEKLRWFNAQFGPENLLQPNRFEVSGAIAPFAHKAYIDLEFDAESARNPGFAHNFAADTLLSAPYLDRPIHFRRAGNPHAGCFFLNRAQMEHWAAQPHFLDGDTRFVSPLESAATMGLIRTFRVFKPDFGCASFLEIEHDGDRKLQGYYRHIYWQDQPAASAAAETPTPAPPSVIPPETPAPEAPGAAAAIARLGKFAPP